MLLVLLVGSVALQVWAWRHLWERVETRRLTRLGSFIRYGLWASAPLLLFVAFFFSAVGLEEWFGVSVLSEPMARATLPVAAFLLGIAVVGWICFGAKCALSRPAPGTNV